MKQLNKISADGFCDSFTKLTQWPPGSRVLDQCRSDPESALCLLHPIHTLTFRCILSSIPGKINYPQTEDFCDCLRQKKFICSITLLH